MPKFLNYSNSYDAFPNTHVYLEKHHMNWNNSKILAKEADYIKRRFLESFFIHFNNDAFNDKTNCFYPNAYYNVKF